ncbi:MAG: hypothetical protein OEY59_07955 [Deltaproteobacteria bacterium]|nr:hypothetical protein [Deltaproteobacteria bacterium]
MTLKESRGYNGRFFGIGLMTFYGFFWLTLLGAILNSGCDSQESSPDSIEAVHAQRQTDLNGAELYELYCSACHNDLMTTNVPNRTADGIFQAILQNLGNDQQGYMGSLMGILETQDIPGAKIELIAEALAKTLDGTEGGKALYRDYCRGCHGELDKGELAKRNKAAIYYGIMSQSQMGFLSLLPDSALAKIEAELTQAVYPEVDMSDGEAVYGYYCAGCHMPLERTTKAKRPLEAIIYATSFNPEMNFISDLSAEAFGLVAGLLESQALDLTLSDGAALYDNLCAGCHRSRLISNKAKRSTEGMVYANDQFLEMGFLSALSTAQLEAIEITLAGIDFTYDASADGPALYDEHCAGCHFELDVSDKPQRNASSIVVAGRVNPEMSFSTGTPATVLSLIETALADSPLPVISDSDGPGLYGAYCSGCHGDLASNDIVDKTEAGIIQKIGSVSSMGFLAPVFQTASATTISLSAALSSP